MYASIFNAPGKRFALLIHETPSLTAALLHASYNTKAEAKAEAKRLNLKAWNY